MSNLHTIYVFFVQDSSDSYTLPMATTDRVLAESIITRVSEIKQVEFTLGEFLKGRGPYE